jgi:hypothetical protein
MAKAGVQLAVAYSLDEALCQLEAWEIARDDDVKLAVEMITRPSKLGRVLINDSGPDVRFRG